MSITITGYFKKAKNKTMRKEQLNAFNRGIKPLINDAQEQKQLIEQYF